MSIESGRIEALKSYHILDTPEESDFNDIIELASEICETPISLISLVDENRQWFKAKKGIDATETAREIAFCDHAIREESIFEVEDTHKDKRFADNPLVTGGPQIRYYAGFPLKNEDGFKLGTICVIDNKPRKLNSLQKKALKVLSRQVINELELRKQVKALENLNDFKDKLLSIIGHDLRGPLGSIHSIIELIDQSALSEKEVKPLRKILSSEVQSSLNLLDNILNWSTLYLEGKEATTKNFNIQQVLDESVNLLKYEIDKKDIKIINKAKDAQAHGDVEMIKLVVRNIIGNAIKFSRSGESIVISSGKSKNYVTIKITDSGVGMTEEQMNRLLNRKGGVSSRGTSQERGTGIGLLLSLEFLEVNNGKLTVDSEPGKGSTFKIKLPAAK